MVVNETDGNGRKAEDVRRVRAVWQEDDNGWEGDFPLSPSIVVQSSIGKYHRYWLVDGQEMRLCEIAHNIFQAACRGHVRRSEGDGCPQGCHLYIIFSTHKTAGIPRSLLERIFPGAKIADWSPVITLSGRAKNLLDLIFSRGAVWLGSHAKGFKLALISWESMSKADAMGDLGVKPAATERPT